MMPGVKADDSVVSTATITVPVSCTMSGTGMNTHTASIENGRLEENIGTTTIKSFCNDNEGFSIYAVGYTGDTIGNNYLRDSNLAQADDILTGTTLSGNTSAWAMKLGATTGTYTPIIAGSSSDTERQSGDTDYSSWAVVPSEYARVAYRNSGTDVDNGSAYAEGASLTTTYAAYISPTQKSGTYVGQVKYTLVHPANADAPLFPHITEAGCIRYYPNGSNVEGTMGCQPITASDTSATLLASNYSREGYGFAGWSTTYDYSDSTGFLGPQEYITFTAGQYTGSNNGLSLYAHWIKSVGSIQGWTGCSSLAYGAVTALTDQRDGETYAVARLADGYCWMIENMRLGNTNSDNATGALAKGYGGQFAGLATPEEMSLFSSTATANTLYSTDGANDTINIGASNAAYRIPRYSNINTPANISNRPQNPTDNTATMYSYGNYYTWPAAIADTTFYTTNNLNLLGTSICPSRWYLPRGGNISNLSYSDFWRLVVNGVNHGVMPANFGITQPYYDDTEAGPIANALRAYPNNFVYSGTINYGQVNERGSGGEYWSSTAGNGYYSYSMVISGHYLDAGTGAGFIPSGATIRCVTTPY